MRQTAQLDIDVLRATRDYFTKLSLYVHPSSYTCARLSAGGVIELTKAVIERQIRNGFAIVRPPGHHAEPDQMMGFCFFNNIAITARWARETYPDTIRRVLILDWDVHHGNGTQKAFYEDDSVLFISLHRYEKGNFYPSTTLGASEHVGEGKGRGLYVEINRSHCLLQHLTPSCLSLEAMSTYLGRVQG